MEEFTKIPQNNRFDIFFEETPSLPPSSLAFFISGFHLTSRVTSSGIKHAIAVRETETNYTEKLFELTEMILDAAESFMKLRLPNEVLHFVALPNYGRSIGAFYGFNYYQLSRAFQTKKRESF